ncbi:transglutaminase family domain-containing protein [Phthorimaea operculella]|nr:transglutaminase family domain-containing protein [Phthorimaea operculella]
MEPLHVDVVHFYPKENAKEHHTVKYEVVNEETPTVTVLRRGQPFNGVVRFDRPFNEEEDVVQLVFSLGDAPQMETQGSVFIRRDVAHSTTSWSAKLNVYEDNSVAFEVSTPVTTPVGCWSLRVVTRLKSSQQREIFDFDQDLYLLFNPWMPEDPTYMENKDLLQEYVLNDIGKIWVGPIKTTRGKPWVFGQFDATVLPACMLMLDKGNMPFHNRGDPIKMARFISKIVNSNDDDGVLVGRWDGQYDDGTDPSCWTGSVEILSEYLETQTPVSYGQCWVFAGVVTTVCRALGLPSRVVTNLVSAHDANSTLTVDHYYTETMEEIPGDPTNPQGADSIWNYHVWNDVWMARPDLPGAYGGWQAIDATPQETSSGFFQCGPASLEAIKQGHTGFGYDVEFMLASVNADLMRWRQDPDSEIGYSMVDTNDYHIGRMILTKKPYVFDPIGDSDRADITLEYKHKEHTGSERAALMNGVRHSSRAKRYYALLSSAKNDIKFQMQDIDSIPIGKSFRVTVDIENTSDEPRNIKATLVATSWFYHGRRGNVVKRADGQIYSTYLPWLLFLGEQISIQVTPEDYLSKMVENYNLKISSMFYVVETKQAWADDDDVEIMRPTVNVKFVEDLIVGKPVMTTLSFVNPLDTELSEGEFRVNSHGIQGAVIRVPAPRTQPHSLMTVELPLYPNDSEISEVEFRCNLHGIKGAVIRVPAPRTQPHSLMTVELPLYPNKLGMLQVVVTYNSPELKGIHGSAAGEVMEE